MVDVLFVFFLEFVNFYLFFVFFFLIVVHIDLLSIKERIGELFFLCLFVCF